MNKLKDLTDELNGVKDFIFQINIRDGDVPQSELINEGYIQGQIDTYKAFIKLINEFPNDKFPEFIKKRLLHELL